MELKFLPVNAQSVFYIDISDIIIHSYNNEIYREDILIFFLVTDNSI